MYYTKEPVSIKQEMKATESDFCVLCGNRYAVGEDLAILTRRPRPEAAGRIAHPACVAKNNEFLARKADRQNGTIEPISIKLPGVNSFDAALALAALDTNEQKIDAKRANLSAIDAKAESAGPVVFETYRLLGMGVSAESPHFPKSLQPTGEQVSIAQALRAEYREEWKKR